jgi:ribosomal protein S18 acetylase RimI-like enzyme
MFRSLVVALGRLWPGSAAGESVTIPRDGAWYPTNPPVRIRPAKQRDYHQICALYEELDAFHRRARPDLFDRVSAPPRSRSAIYALIKSGSATILVAQDAGSERLRGFVVLMICELPASTVCRARRFVEIDKLVVDSTARRGGIGRALLDEAIAWAESAGLGCLEVAVNEFNTGAIALYESMGFETVLRRLTRKG